MRKATPKPGALTLLLLLAAAIAHSQTAARAAISIPQWPIGLAELNRGWVEHDGDNSAWAQPQLDEASWQPVDIETTDAAQPGWHWFRLHVNVGPNHPNPFLLINAGDGVYELYVNGQRIPQARIRSQFLVTATKERVFPLSDPQGDFHIALRTFATPSFVAWQFSLIKNVSIGEQTAISYERRNFESLRLYDLIPCLAINLLVVMAGLGALALYTTQRTQREYLYLALFLLLIGTAALLWRLQHRSILPLSANFLLGGPLSYLLAIAQIEFTFSFVHRPLTRAWRAYEAILLLPLLAVLPAWFGYFSENSYVLLGAVVLAPAAFLLPALLFLWYRRGNREAGWLILPSLLPNALNALWDVGLSANYLGFHQFSFLNSAVPIGPIPFAPSDVANFLFVMAIAVVIFFRFTRVSRDQARAAAELDAAREIQQRLVPIALPDIPNCRIQAVYLPAQEVGGDFYQVLQQPKGSTLIVVGDVSGKGLRAAMTGARAIGALQAIAAAGPSPAALLEVLNRQIHSTGDSGFITCLCASLSSEGLLTLANAGHLAPYRNGIELPLENGLPLGITADAAYEQTTFQLAPDDRLVLLSDGVVEAQSPSGELFGFDRTAAISTQSAEEIASAAQQFGQEDDITVLTLAFAPAEVLHA